MHPEDNKELKDEAVKLGQASRIRFNEAGFLFVDTAINGPQNRNQVMKIAEFDPPEGTPDVFTTYLKFTKNLQDYTEQNLSPTTGQPSVAGYPGPALAEYVPFDFDDKNDPGKAVAEAAHFVRRWEIDHGIPPEALRIYFSGMKGVSIDVPAELFGGFEPATDIAQRLGKLAMRMTLGAKTLDHSMYQKMRLWRVPNTLHGGSNLYKVRITAKELLDGDR